MLMERMKLLQESQQEEEGVTQEEMATRFELEKTESLLVAPSGEEVQGCSWLGWGPRGLGVSQGREGGAGWGPQLQGCCSGVTQHSLPCRPVGSLPAVQRPLLCGGP